MTIALALPHLIGNLNRFGPLSDRVEGLVEAQVAHFHTGVGEWLILPWSDGFFLFSADSEGQRRGREVVQAFLGPSVAVLESVTDEFLQTNLPPAWVATGLLRASRLRRLRPGNAGAGEMIARLEDLVASVSGRTPATLMVEPSHSDLLRDFRLALLRLDDDSARSLLDRVKLTGHVSAENLRYLRIEYLAAFGRWSELYAMPHIGALLKARRPRTISEHLLRMVWWAELAVPNAGGPLRAFSDRDVQGRYGALLQSVRMPTTPEGRSVAFLSAISLGDRERQSELLERTANSDEQAALTALMREAQLSQREAGHETPEPRPADPVTAAFRDRRFTDVVREFTANPAMQHVEVALEAVLDSGEETYRAEVLRIVQDFEAAGQAQLSRRGRRDLEELSQLLATSCAGWKEWATRLAGAERWSDGNATVRDQRASWAPLGSISGSELSDVCDALVEASESRNSDQLRMSLDVLCREAADLLESGRSNDFCQVVLMLLSTQDNLSEMVRNAYLDLFAAWLAAGPTTKEYGEALGLTAAIWRRIASPNAVDWACNTLEAMADAPCPSEDERLSIVAVMLEGIRLHSGRLSLRQQVEVEGLASDFGLPVRDVVDRFEERNAWGTLDGKYIGIYSLLAGADVYLRKRLAKLCAVGEVKGNSDKVATQPLKSLAERADYLIVDTWHAAHAATGAIDAVRPKSRQILPKSRGNSGFLRALEEHLNG